MKRSKLWLCALAIALGCTSGARLYGAEAAFDESIESTVSTVRLASASTWNADPETNPMAASTPSTSTASQEPLGTPPAATQAWSESAAKGDLACGCTETCCCEPEYSLIGSVEATFFFPQFNRGFLTNSIENGGETFNFATNSAVGTTEGSLLVAPRITLGVQGCRWGLVGRYWYASQWASGYTPNDPSLTPAGVIALDGFRAYTIDLEAQRKFYPGAWTAYGFFGVRYAQADNDRILNASGLNVDESISASSFASQQFSGTGVTFGLWGVRPICCDSPLKYFVANRYSFLWGNADVAAQTTATVTNDADGFATSTNGALATTQGDLFIAEVQLGLQWDAQLKCFPGRAFVRTAIEYQYWDTNAGVNATANSFASIAGGGAATADASAGDILFNLIGLNLGAGITY